MVTRYAAVFAAAAICALTGCDKKEAPAGAAKTPAPGAADQAGDPLQMAKDSVLNAVNDQIGKIDGFVEKLKGSASKVAADQKPEFDKALAGIDSGMSTLKTKIDEMKAAGAMQWQSIGAEVSDTAAKLYNEAKAAVDKWVK